MELFERGYTNITSVAFDTAPTSPTIHFFHKFMHSEKGNSTISIHMDFTQDGMFEIKKMIISSNDNILTKNIKDKIQSFEIDISIYTYNTSLNKKDFFIFTLR